MPDGPRRCGRAEVLDIGNFRFPRKEYASHRTSKFGLIPLAKLHCEVNAPYLVKNWLAPRGFSVVYGNSSVGKTFFALDLGIHVAAGSTWHGAKVCNPDGRSNRVLLVEAEGRRTIETRVAAMRIIKPGLLSTAEDSFHVMFDGVDFHASEDTRTLAEQIGAQWGSIDLIIVDTLARTFGAGDENVAKDMNMFVRSIDNLRDMTGAHVMVLHHSGKDNGKGARGSSALRAAADTEIKLTKKDSTVVASAEKQRDLPTGSQFEFSLKSIEIGMDEDGDPVTSAVVEPTRLASEAPRHRDLQKLSRQQTLALEALKEAIRDNGEPGEPLPSSMERSPVTIARWREECDRLPLSKGGSPNAVSTAFARARDALQLKGIVQIEGLNVWLCSDG